MRKLKLFLEGVVVIFSAVEAFCILRLREMNSRIAGFNFFSAKAPEAELRFNNPGIALIRRFVSWYHGRLVLKGRMIS
jgi:hypothetical protein